MSGGSLRLRLVARGIVAILLALAVAGAGLAVLFERHVARTIADDLEIHLKQLLAGIDIGQEGRLVLTRTPVEPSFAEPLSGLYWQIENDHGQILRSRSLWDTTLTLPADDPSPGEVHQHEIPGPANARVLVAEGASQPDRRGSTRAGPSGGGRRSCARIRSGCGICKGPWRGTRPARRRAGGGDSDPGRPWSAASPCVASRRCRRQSGTQPASANRSTGRGAARVDEVNALLDGQDREIERSRGRAADLAPG